MYSEAVITKLLTSDVKISLGITSEHSFKSEYVFHKSCVVRGVIKTFLARCASVRFIELKSFFSQSFGLFEGHWKCENMRSWLVAYIDHF